MGIYGKYTKIVAILSCVQISLGVLMIGLGLAFRLLVCSWITDAAFGFWVGCLVLIGGVFGYCSATKDNYSYIGIYLGFNSFSIMFASLVIFCHSIAFVHFNHQMRPPPISNFTNVTSANFTNSSSFTTPIASYHHVNRRAVQAPKSTTPLPSLPSPSPPPTTTTTNATTNVTANVTSFITTVSASVPTNATGATGDAGPRCYTHKTWSDYENGARGMGLGATMIFLCFVEILMSVTSSACCWAATKVQPNGVRRKQAIIQGTVSEILRAQNFEMLPRRRHGGHVVSSSFNVYDNVKISTTTTTDEHADDEENTYETIPTASTSAQMPDEPVTNWYSTTV